MTNIEAIDYAVQVLQERSELLHFGHSAKEGVTWCLQALFRQRDELRQQAQRDAQSAAHGPNDLSTKEK